MINKQTSKWMNEWMNQYINEWMDKMLVHLRRRKQKPRCHSTRKIGDWDKPYWTIVDFVQFCMVCIQTPVFQNGTEKHIERLIISQLCGWNVISIFFYHCRNCTPPPFYFIFYCPMQYDTYGYSSGWIFYNGNFSIERVRCPTAVVIYYRWGRGNVFATTTPRPVTKDKRLWWYRT